MGDFHQTETISTLHRLKKDNVEKLEEQFPPAYTQSFKGLL